MHNLKALAIVGLFAAAANAAPTTSGVETRTAVPAQQDGCLDHTVKELGMSAKKQDAARRWDIAPKFLHGALATDKDGTFLVEIAKAADGKTTTIHVAATWPGALKDKAVQLEIEERMRAMTLKMAQLCGVTKPDIQCTTTTAGAAAPCAPVAP